MLLKIYESGHILLPVNEIGYLFYSNKKESNNLATFARKIEIHRSENSLYYLNKNAN